MLINIGRQRYTPESTLDSVHNYYEQMVFDELSQSSERARTDSEFRADTACVALNQLPSRYVRHDVDMTFFLSPNDLNDMINRVKVAVKEAIDYVESREK